LIEKEDQGRWTMNTSLTRSGKSPGTGNLTPDEENNPIQIVYKSYLQKNKKYIDKLKV